MDFGVVLQTNPPAWRVVELTKQAELLGFTHAWTFDSHLLWEEPFVIYSQMLSATHRIVVGPMVTNPATRDWTVTVSLFATLNEMFGNRTICGIGRGDSAVRVTNGKPTSLATLRDAITVIRGLANGEEVDYRGSRLRFPWNPDSRLDVWVAAYGPKALALTGEVGDGFILQLADPDIVAWSVGGGARGCGRRGPRSRGGEDLRGRARVRRRRSRAPTRPVPLVRRHGGQPCGRHRRALRRGGAQVPAALTAYIEGRHGYDYNEHGRAGNVHADFVPDDVIDRFCLFGPADKHIERLRELQDLGVDQFAIYLQHDAKEATLQAYGEHVIPAVGGPAIAKR